MKQNNGKIWPFAITLSIVAVIGLSAWTIVVASKMPVQESDIYMTNYQDADANANKIINAAIAFNKKYTVEYIGKQLDVNNTEIVYKITTKDGKAVDDANVKVVVTRPQSRQFDMTLDSPKISNGVYTFNTKLPGIGRWDIMASIEVGGEKRYYNLHDDTRFNNKPLEY